MKTYKEFQEEVFNWLYGKHKSDPSFTFSMRMMANKGSETNFFIGTEKAKYFGTTFWNIPIGYPGSASDLIDLFFQLKSTGYYYYFYFNQTKNPDSDQNKYGLDFIRQIKPLIKAQFDNFRETTPEGKMENYTFGPNIIYPSIEPLTSSVEQDIVRLTKLVDDELTKFKDLYPAFKAHRLTLNEFEELYQKLQKRRDKYLILEGVKANAEGESIPIEKPKKDILEVLASKNKPSLNQILHGPPGTGKTYHTINKAIAIANPIFDLTQKREKIKEEFERLMKEGRVVFTTFHQSMSYEDFIEGIKPLPPIKGDSFADDSLNVKESVGAIQTESLKYDIRAGILKKACVNAAYLSYRKYLLSKQNSKKYSFDDLYESFVSHALSLINKKNFPTYLTKNGKVVEIYRINSQDSIKARGKGSKSIHTAPLTKENIQKLYDKFDSVDEIENLQQIRDTVQITPRITEFYAVFRGIKDFEKTYKPEVFDEITIDAIDESEKLKKFDAGVFDSAVKAYGKETEPVVLIIDEINRGNVSQIFGELITLIEDDKRLGNDEALEVILPYSQKSFSVPPNLHIIGTMNTADRSVEAIDTALRRRFCFEEMPPKYDLEELQYEFDGTKGSEILRTLNKRIEKLLDKDHQIGHSYFMLKKDEDVENKLLNSFYRNIIPLLQEYFFGDFGKIGLVLGKGFVRMKSWDKNSDSFADFDYQSSSEFDDREVFEIVDYRNLITNYTLKMKEKEVSMDFHKAIKLLMKQDIE